jgi:sulfonate transport system substrate-binding protein
MRAMLRKFGLEDKRDYTFVEAPFPPERFEWIFTKRDYYRDPNMMPNLDALQKNVDMTKDLGFVRASFDVKKHADLSIVEEAARRLK